MRLFHGSVILGERMMLNFRDAEQCHSRTNEKRGQKQVPPARESQREKKLLGLIFRIDTMTLQFTNPSYYFQSFTLGVTLLIGSN